MDIEIPILELSGFRSDNEMGPISYTIEYGRGEGDLINLHGTRSYEEKMERYFANNHEWLVILATQKLQGSITNVYDLTKFPFVGNKSTSFLKTLLMVIYAWI